jgi:hypothetical protein
MYVIQHNSVPKKFIKLYTKAILTLDDELDDRVVVARRNHQNWIAKWAKF